MEKFKQRTKQYKYFGLLAFLFVLATQNVFAFSWKSLLIKPENEHCFTGDICVFKLEIPGVLPSRVEFTVQTIPNNVTLLSSDKEEYLKEGERGTVVSFKIRFSKSGTYKIPAIAAHIDWVWSTIPFAPITVYENPRLLTPELSADIPNTMKLGETFTFTLYGKYFSELISINSELNPKFILKQTKLFVDLPYSTTGFSTQKVPLAEYQITPIDVGTFTIPQISIHCRSYSEAINDIQLTIKTVDVSSPTEQDDNTLENGTFFESLKAYQTETDTQNTNNEELITSVLANELHKQKIHTIVLHSLGALLFLAVIGLIVAIIVKRTKFQWIFGISILIWLTLFIILNVFLSIRFCISDFCKVNIIPEHDSNSVMQLTAGTKIKIIDETSEWFFIETNDKRNGWILKSNCKVIGE